MFGFCLLACLAWRVVGAHVNHSHEHKAYELKQKWGVVNVIRDIDHIKEDLSSFIELADVGKLSESELAFYIIRMHDFDDNSGLDGIELRVAIQHSMEHMEPNMDESTRNSKIEQTIDDLLKWDLNSDGFVDYGELSRQFIDSQDGRQG